VAGVQVRELVLVHDRGLDGYCKQQMQPNCQEKEEPRGGPGERELCYLLIERPLDDGP
jgi:hypothetical protein